MSHLSNSSKVFPCVFCDLSKVITHLKRNNQFMSITHCALNFVAAFIQIFVHCLCLMVMGLETIETVAKCS